jgi:hypothetical protein
MSYQRPEIHFAPRIKERNVTEQREIDLVSDGVWMPHSLSASARPVSVVMPLRPQTFDEGAQSTAAAWALASWALRAPPPSSGCHPCKEALELNGNIDFTHHHCDENRTSKVPF